jgi:hypothetical protein
MLAMASSTWPRAAHRCARRIARDARCGSADALRFGFVPPMDMGLSDLDRSTARGDAECRQAGISVPMGGSRAPAPIPSSQ